MVDLGSNQNINRVKVTWDSALYARDYAIQISPNGIDGWTTLRTISANTAAVNDSTGLSGSGRFVRVNITAPATGKTQVRLKETEVYAAAAVGLPAPWQLVDIGTSGGTASFSGDTFTINGAGSGVAGTSDRFSYLCQPASGDCDITVRVVNASTYGVMIRADLTPGSAFKSLYINSSGGGFTVSRTGAGLTATAVAAGGGLTRPHYLRLKRVANEFTVSRSLDGINWTQAAAPQTFVMPASAFIGIVQPQSTGSLYDNVSANP